MLAQLELEKASWHREKALLEQKQNEKSLNTGGVNPDEMLLKRVEAEFEMLKLEKARMQEALRVAEERELQLFQQLEQEKMLSRMVMHPQQAHFLQMFRQREQMAQMGMPANVHMNESMMHGRMEESGGVGMGMPPPNRGPVVDMNNVMMNPYLQQMQSMNNMQVPAHMFAPLFKICLDRDMTCSTCSTCSSLLSPNPRPRSLRLRCQTRGAFSRKLLPLR